MERVPILAVGDLKSELSQMDRRHLGDLLLPCVYRKLKSDYNGDEVRQGWRVNE